MKLEGMRVIWEVLGEGVGINMIKYIVSVYESLKALTLYIFFKNFFMLGTLNLVSSTSL